MSRMHLDIDVPRRSGQAHGQRWPWAVGRTHIAARRDKSDGGVLRRTASAAEHVQIRATQPQISSLWLNLTSHMRSGGERLRAAVAREVTGPLSSIARVMTKQ